MCFKDHLWRCEHRGWRYMSIDVALISIAVVVKLFRDHSHFVWPSIQRILWKPWGNKWLSLSLPKFYVMNWIRGYNYYYYQQVQHINNYNYICLHLQDAETATSVVVKAPVRGVTVNCPEYMATYTPDTCSIDVNRGTDLNITITYDDGILHTSNFPIAGKYLKKIILLGFFKTYSYTFTIYFLWSLGLQGSPI